MLPLKPIRAEALAQRRNVLGRTHAVNAIHAELAGHVKHDRGLAGVARGVLARFRKHDVSVDVDERRHVGAEMAALAEVEAGPVVLGGGRHVVKDEG